MALHVTQEKGTRVIFENGCGAIPRSPAPGKWLWRKIATYAYHTQCPRPEQVDRELQDFYTGVKPLYAPIERYQVAARDHQHNVRV
ncbi:hypothetical protein FHL15_009973 [Xylaria flabelliformis]|uniref:Uncharacterized protein n=1 Tax=Xylaria flabelliformis TaxID=2512241 RepID=A0A553HMH3_9PEZI|nr:hypothetical protein FHL15_009973 [Xylaria flabelliformis]